MSHATQKQESSLKKDDIVEITQVNDRIWRGDEDNSVYFVVLFVVIRQSRVANNGHHDADNG